MDLTVEDLAIARGDGLCHYCGEPIKLTCYGLDRKDNSRGYTLDNVVPSCFPCNASKLDRFTYEEMVARGPRGVAFVVSKRLRSAELPHSNSRQSVAS